MKEKIQKSEAVITEQEFTNAVELILAYRQQLNQQIFQIDSLQLASPDWKVVDINISVELWNSLASYNYQFEVFGTRDMSEVTTRQLADISEYDFRKWRGVGNKRIQELKTILAMVGLRMKP